MAFSDVIKKFFQPTEDVRIRDVAREAVTSAIPKGISGLIRGFQKSGQFSNQGFAAVGGALTGAPITPRTQFQKDLFGTDQPITLSSIAAQVGITGKFAPLAGFALGAADIVPGGKPVKKVVQVTAKALQLSKERGFIQSAKGVIPKALKIAGQYIPRGTDELSAQARNLIATDLAQAEKIATGQASDKAVAIASELLKKYADDAAKATSQTTKTAL